MVSRLFVVVCLATAAAAAQQSGHLIVTAEYSGNSAQPVPRDEIAAQVNKKSARVVDWTPLTGDQASLELYIVLDDADSSSVATQFGDLKNFINSLSASTQVGIAYLRYGTALIAQAPTSDHARAAAALRIPLAQPGIEASPYLGLQDLVKKWPQSEGRREILAIMSGSDPYYQSPDLLNPYLSEAIETAQKAGVIISSIYQPTAGHFGHSYFRQTWAQNYLSMLDDQTGGEYYWEGFGRAVSFQPFLKEFSGWLAHQYRLTVEGEGSGKAELQPIQVTVMRKDVSLQAPAKIYIGPLQSAGGRIP